MATTKKGVGDQSSRKAGQHEGSARKKVPGQKRAVPRIRASHAGATEPRGDGAPAPRRRARDDGGLPPRPAPKAAKAPRKAPLAPPKRAGGRRSVPPVTQPSDEARQLALVIAGAGLDKKAIGIEILEVAGRVDYADYLVIMTGRSDRHVHAIATGIEEAMRRKKHAALSIEGLTAATWVLLDFGDVVVHVFQEDTRRLYDIEGLWIDAGRIPVPEGEGGGGPERPAPPAGPITTTRVLS